MASGGDNKLIGQAGEFLVCAELCKKGPRTWKREDLYGGQSLSCLSIFRC